MIVVDKPKLKFLLRGQTITATGHRASGYRKDKLYSVGTTHHRAVCRVQILKATATDDGWLLEIRHAAEDLPNLLARNPGAQRRDYVSNSAQAMREEPEAISSKELAPMSAAASARDEQLRRQAAHARRLKSQGRNLSAVQVESDVAPPPADTQADGPVGQSLAFLVSETAA